MHFEDLTDVHSGRHAEGIEKDLQRGAVGQEGHIGKRQHAGDDALVAVTACHLVAHLDLALLRDVDAHELVDAGRKFVLVFAGEDLDVDDDTALAVRHAEGGVAHFTRLLAEDGAKETLFGGEFGFALGGDFPDEDIAAVDFGADADDAVLVEVLQSVVAHVGDGALPSRAPRCGWR